MYIHFDLLMVTAQYIIKTFMLDEPLSMTNFVNTMLREFANAIAYHHLFQSLIQSKGKSSTLEWFRKLICNFNVVVSRVLLCTNFSNK